MRRRLIPWQTMPWHNLLPSASHAKHFPEHLPSVSLKQRAPLIRAPSGVEIYRKTNVANVARRRRRLTESRHNRPLYILPPCLIFSHFYNALKGAANKMCYIAWVEMLNCISPKYTTAQHFAQLCILYCTALFVLCFGTLHSACPLDGEGCLLF